jgi:hypothetical protein
MNHQWQMARGDWLDHRDVVLSHDGPKVRELARATDSFFESPWPLHAAGEGWEPVHAFGLSPSVLDGKARHATDEELLAQPDMLTNGAVVAIGVGAANAILNIEGPIATVLAFNAYTGGKPKQLRLDTRLGDWSETEWWWRLPAYRDGRGPRQLATI